MHPTLDSWAQTSQFVSYDSDSKGYRIYWPNKRTISIEQNIIFNNLDVYSRDSTTVLQGDVSAEGESDKIIQPTQNHPVAMDERIQSAQNKDETTEHPPPTHDPKVSIELSNKALPNLDKTCKSGHPQSARKPKGAYKLMHEGMSAAVALTDLWDESYHPDTTNFTHINTGPKPRSLEEALHGPNGVEWNDMLKYKISQLKKLGPWVIEDLPKKPIPCSEVLKENADLLNLPCAYCCWRA